VRYGGNTSCVEVTDEAGRLVILDAGTGIRALGKALLARNGPDGVMADILLSHAHWDHIQGLPYFAPLFLKGNVIRVWGPRQGDVGMQTILRQMMHPAVFPVPLDALAATLEVEHVGTDPIPASGFAVQAMRVRHPAHTVGYRLQQPGGPVVVYVPDDELGTGGDYEVSADWRRRFLEFVGGADLLIHDSMYTADEIATHRGWGHSSVEEAVALAHEAGVKRLALFHHEPEHGDEQMDGILARTREAAARLAGRLEVIAAAEGAALSL
jgi:phosphoribosyl 1,2-cyclic phosphodiesterase